MNEMISKLIRLMALMTVLLFAAGCIEVGKVRTDSKKVELGGAGSVSGELRMCSGELKVARDTEKLLSADFTYNNERRPELDYRVRGSEGNFMIRQQDCDPDHPGSAIRNEWDIRLNSGVPMALVVDLGAGKGDLRLGSLNLTSLDIKIGAGEAKIDLSSSRSLTNLSLNMGAGKAVVDMSGAWKQDLDASFHGGVGKLTLLLPRDVGVVVDTNGGTGIIKADGMKMDGNSFVNEAFGRSNATLNIEIESGVGEIILEVGE